MNHYESGTTHEKELSMFTSGDKVAWDSQANGSMVTKKGTILCCIAAGEDPKHRVAFTLRTQEGLSTNHDQRNRYDFSPMDGINLRRNHRSYVVMVPPVTGKAKPKLYWPRVSQLTKVE